MEEKINFFSDCVLWINLIKLFIKRVCKNINFVSL